uniref:Odorant-binding protein 57de n=1 Tax=Drosophila obscura TaxID=7282 RepID=B0M2C3_DROOB|nr:odorant-binding protein 57de [Drosophila obscura]
MSVPVRVVFLLLSLLLLYGSAHSNSSIYDPCRSQNYTTPEEQRSFLDNWPKDWNASELDRSVKCYATCILFEMQLLDKSGHLHMERYLEAEALQESWPDSVDNCRTELADSYDSCEYFSGMANCLLSLRAARE